MAAADSKSGDSRRVSELCPEAFERLMRFQWEYVRYRERNGAEWVAVRQHTVSEAGVDPDGPQRQRRSSFARYRLSYAGRRSRSTGCGR